MFTKNKFYNIIIMNITKLIEFDRAIPFSDVQGITLSPYKENIT